MTKCAYYLHCIKLCLHFWNVIFLAKELKQVATTYKIHNEIDLEVILEDIPGTNHKLVMCLRQNTLLEEACFDHVCVDDVLLFNRLHRKHLFSLFLLYQENLAKAALTYKSFDFEIFEIGHFVCVSSVFHFSFRIIVFKIIPCLVNDFQFLRRQCTIMNTLSYNRVKSTRGRIGIASIRLIHIRLPHLLQVLLDLSTLNLLLHE